jgi:predicted nucleotide-binding protein
VPRGRAAGKKNRTTPPLPLAKALAVAEGIAHQASGMKVSRLTLAEILDTTPTSSAFRDLVASSRFYGLTNGGINSAEFELSELGEQATSDDVAVREAALKTAVMTVPAHKTFLDAFVNKRVPAAGPFREFLLRDAGVPPEYVDEAMKHLAEDMATAGLVRNVKGNDWVDLTGAPRPASTAEDDPEPDPQETGLAEGAPDAGDGITPAESLPPKAVEPRTDPGKKRRPNRLFVGHGKNKKPLEQLTKVLRDLGIPHLVAEDEPNAGRPISKKVRDTMDQCGAAILIFSADVEYFDKDQNAVWRPSENVSHELGAAAVMYDDRIILFKEESVALASNFSGIGYITFEKDKLDAKTNELLRELVALKILRMSIGEDVE